MKILRLCVPLLFLSLLAGCLSAPTAKPQNWLELFESDITLATPPAPYSLERTQSDLTTLKALTREMEALNTQMTRMWGQRPFTPDQIEQENEKIEMMLFRFINARDALHDLLTYYQHSSGETPDIHTRGAVIGMSAGLNLSYYESRIAALFLGQKQLLSIMNAAHPQFEIPEGLHTKILSEITDANHGKALVLSWHLFSAELKDPDGPLSHLLKTDPVYAEVIQDLFTLYTDTFIQIDYLQYAVRYGVSDLSNGVSNGRLHKISEEMKHAVGEDSYKTRGFLFKNVARIKTTSFHLAQFSDEQVSEIKSKLQPGDVILTYTAGYMSDVFLPGSFKHGITYIGSVEERKAAGLSEQALAQAAVSDHQREELLARLNLEKTPEGDPVNVIEAVAEGVMMHSLDHLLATHINRLVVLRPNITPLEKQQQLITLFQYVGADYDFKFDFLNDSYQCCTELVYRSLNEKGSIEFTLSSLKGRWVLDADGIAEYAVLKNPEAFELILFTDTAPKSEGYKAILYEGDEAATQLKALLTTKK